MRRHLRLEALESRQMMAGNVLVSLSSNNLVVNGDDAPNVISIESAGTNSIQVRGFNDVNGNPTFVNGIANGVVFFNGASGGLTVRTYGGNDNVRITNLVVNSAINVDTGSESDTLLLGRDPNNFGGVRFGGYPAGPLFAQTTLDVTTGGGNDLIYSTDIRVRSNASLDMGSGNDRLRFSPNVDGLTVNSMQGISEFQRSLYVQMGQGADTVLGRGVLVYVSGTFDDFSGALNYGLTGAEFRSNLNFFTSSAPDNINVTDTLVRRDLNIYSGAGNDDINLNNSRFFDQVHIETGAGNDTLQFNRPPVISSHINQVQIYMGDGADYVRIDDLNVDTLLISQEGADDVAEIINSTGGTFTFDGGAGSDDSIRFIRDANRTNDFRAVLRNYESRRDIVR